MSQSRLREITREQLILAVRLGALLGGSGVVFWQLMRANEPMASGIFVAVPAEVRAVGAAILFSLTLLALLILVRHNLRKPMRQLAACVAEQNIGNTQRLPSVLLNRTDDVGRLTREISRLIDKVTEQNEQLLEQTLYDPLTGLGNRRLLQRRLEAILPLNQRMMMPLSALMIDVDLFKVYNDYYGHLAGDACLIEIANVLCDTFRRDTDTLIRLGGEEFLVILVDVDQKSSYELAEAMRSMLQLVSIPHVQSTVSNVVTVSIGVATVDPGTHIDVDQLIACADSALYECKRLGGNRSFCQTVTAESLAD